MVRFQPVLYNGKYHWPQKGTVEGRCERGRGADGTLETAQQLHMRQLDLGEHVIDFVAAAFSADFHSGLDAVLQGDARYCPQGYKKAFDVLRAKLKIIHTKCVERIENKIAANARALGITRDEHANRNYHDMNRRSNILVETFPHVLQFLKSHDFKHFVVGSSANFEKWRNIRDRLFEDLRDPAFVLETINDVLNSQAVKGLCRGFIIGPDQNVMSHGLYLGPYTRAIESVRKAIENKETATLGFKFGARASRGNNSEC